MSHFRKPQLFHRDHTLVLRPITPRRAAPHHGIFFLGKLKIPTALLLSLHPRCLILQEMSHREAKRPRGKDHTVGGTTGRGLGLLVSASALTTHPCPRHEQRRWEVDQPESATRVGGASAPTRSLTAMPSQRPGVPTAPLTPPHSLSTPGAQTQCQRPPPYDGPCSGRAAPGSGGARACPCLGVPGTWPACHLNMLPAAQR